MVIMPKRLFSDGEDSTCFFSMTIGDSLTNFLVVVFSNQLPLLETFVGMNGHYAHQLATFISSLGTQQESSCLKSQGTKDDGGVVAFVSSTHHS